VQAHYEQSIKEGVAAGLTSNTRLPATKLGQCAMRRASASEAGQITSPVP
jgi:hypothetical protein